MHEPYKPPQDTVVSRIRTSAGEIRATFHIPRGHAFADHLARFTFWNLTNVSLPGMKEPAPFFSLRSAAALIVIPEAREATLNLPPQQGIAERHRIACLLQRFGTVTGAIELRPDARVSDYLMHHSGFFCLRDARLGEEETFPVVLVNAAALVGVSEPSFNR